MFTLGRTVSDLFFQLVCVQHTTIKLQRILRMWYSASMGPIHSTNPHSILRSRFAWKSCDKPTMFHRSPQTFFVTRQQNLPEFQAGFPSKVRQGCNSPEFQAGFAMNIRDTTCNSPEILAGLSTEIRIGFQLSF